VSRKVERCTYYILLFTQADTTLFVYLYKEKLHLLIHLKRGSKKLEKAAKDCEDERKHLRKKHNLQLPHPTKLKDKAS
jgi:hypothetical protein